MACLILAAPSAPTFWITWQNAIDLASLRALRGLWHDLVGAAPAWRRITGSAWSPAPPATRASASSAGLPRSRKRAGWNSPFAPRGRGAPAAESTHVLPGGVTLDEEVRWLRQVAAAIHSRQVRAVAAELSEAPLTHLQQNAY
jgi:hypothetical protein